MTQGNSLQPDIADDKAPKAFRITRAVFIVLNTLFFFLGVAVVAICLYFKVGKEEYFKLFKQYEFEVSSSLLLAAGVLAIVTAIVGYVGIVWKMSVALIFYFMLVIVIFAVEVSAGAIALTNRSKVGDEIEARLLISMKDTKLTKNWDKLQREQDCCGVVAYTDWQQVTGYGKLSIPSSCCKRPTKSCGRNIDNIEQEGCLEKLRKFLTRSDTIYMIGAAGIAIGVLQIVLAVSVVILIAQLRRYRKAKVHFLYSTQQL